MGSSAEKKGLSNKVVILVALLVVLIVVAGAVYMVSRAQPQAESSGGVIGYAAEAKVMLEEDALQAAVDEALANDKNGSVALRYKNNAYSEDGTHFTCSITNSQDNLYDMFLTMYADAEMTDQIFLSGLVPPGSGFEEITLDRALESGTHTIYVAVTQVDTDENGEQKIVRQVAHTMDFHVSE